MDPPRPAAKADDAWPARDEMLRRVVEEVRDFAIFTMDVQGVINAWNSGAENLFGHPAASIIGRSSDLLYIPADRAAQVPEREREHALRTGRSDDERWHLRADGRQFFASGSISPVFDEAGALLGFSKICRDVTERQRAQDALRRLARQQRLVLDAAHLGWWQLDPETGTMLWDARARQMHDLEGETLHLDDAFARLHPDDRTRLRRRIEELMAHPPDEPVAESYRIVRADGSIRYVESWAQASFEYTGEPSRLCALVGTLKDVTGERRVEEVLRGRDSALHQLADTLPQIAWSAGPDGTVDYFNRRWYEYTGLEPGQVAEPGEAAVTPDAERVREAWREAVQAGRPFELEYRLRRGADGMERWHLGRAVPVRNADGEIERWVGTNTDIHDRKLLEASKAELLRTAIEARRAAEDACRMKDEFLATISHELRTPLNAIVGWATLLQESGLDDPAGREGIEAIQRNAEAQARLIEDILDLARVSTGRLRINAQPLGLGPVLKAAVDTVRGAARGKTIGLTLDLPSHLPEVQGDPDRLQQVFWNLLTNAIKFTLEGGRVHLWAGASDGQVVVSIRDNGVGIEPAFVPRVFEQFLQADARTTRRQGGLGLGLALVRHLVELHGGRVTAQSAGAGQGSTFVVELPAVAEAPAAAPPAASAAARNAAAAAAELEGKRVLVLDDDADTRRVIEAVLARAGAEVTVVGSVADAVGVLTVDHRFDAVLSDIGMPGEDGFVFAKRMRALEEARRQPRLPLAAVTAYTREQDRSHARAVGFDAFVSKPIRPSELVEIVSVMAHSRPRR